MSAEAMFKELGFYEEQSEVINSRIWCLNEDCRIIFDAINEVIFLENVSYVPLQLLDAINKQIEELKWKE